MKKNIILPIFLISVSVISVCIMLFIYFNHKKNLPTVSYDAFYTGCDLSSILQVEENGGKFYDFDQKEKDIFELLKENGMNSVRIRIWNDPVDENGVSYGNGHNDLATAIEIGKRASANNLRVFADFHYSDFWADPSSQKAPRSWENLTFDEKKEALYEYTKSSLKALLDNGVNVTMVQIGNETTSGLAGETEWENIAILMNQGSKAVRDTAAEYNTEILVAMHFTEYIHYDYYASILEKYQVDYDVFASSYYPYWHGSLSGLEASLLNIINKYHKKVLIAEFSYPYNLYEADDAPNAVSYGGGNVFPYAVTRQGQKEAINDIYKTATALGDDCLGLFYWEPAWLPATDTALPGSAWENQALFDNTGHALPSLDGFFLSENH